MKILALIPARGGSKRIENKNIRELAGKPLITWTIEVTRGIKSIADVMVSTDSPKIAMIAEAQGALVPWLRPPELSTDTASSMAVCIHAIDWYEKENGPVDGLILLQPTSPFRTAESIQQAIDIFSAHPKISIVSFSPAESHPMWCYRLEGDAMVPFVKNKDEMMRSQDLPDAYVANGSIYIASPTYLRNNKNFIRADTLPLILQDRKETLDIDTEWDWKLAEIYAKKS